MSSQDPNARYPKMVVIDSDFNLDERASLEPDATLDKSHRFVNRLPTLLTLNDSTHRLRVTGMRLQFTGEGRKRIIIISPTPSGRFFYSIIGNEFPETPRTQPIFIFCNLVDPYQVVGPKNHPLLAVAFPQTNDAGAALFGPTGTSPLLRCAAGTYNRIEIGLYTLDRLTGMLAPVRARALDRVTLVVSLHADR